MFKYFRDLGRALLLGTTLVATSYCGGNKPAKETTFKEQSRKSKRSRPSKSSESDAQVFAALHKATTMSDLPFLMDDDGIVNIPCFNIIEGLAPQDANFEFRGMINDYENQINQAIRNWFIEDLAPSGLSESIASNWQIKVEDPVVLSVQNQDVRFIPDQQCVDERRGWLREDTIAVTTLVGGRKFKFSSSTPVDNYLQEEMIQAVGMQNMVLESPTLFVYEPATDGVGNPMINREGQQLYKSPSGSFITEQEIPPLEERLMKEWTLTSEVPLYFAYRELSRDGWRREFKKDVCNVYLVWGDVTPRPPECDEFSESGFSAKKGLDGEVEVTITTGDNATQATLSYGNVSVIPVSDRILLWIKPKKIEEGVMLRLNSLVLNPQNVAGMTRSKSKSTYVPTREAEPEMVFEEEKEEQPSRPKREKQKKRDNMTDQESIDAFLND